MSLFDGLTHYLTPRDGCKRKLVALLDLDPALLRRQPPPQSQAIEHAFIYANTHLIP